MPSDSKKGISAALSAAKCEFKSIKKNKQGYGYMYADLEEVLAAVEPALRNHGILIVHSSYVRDGVEFMTTKLHHTESGEELESSLALGMIDQDMQKKGSAITYTRRYQVGFLCGVVPNEDDDGKSASTEEKDPFTGNPVVKKSAEQKKADPNFVVAPDTKDETEWAGYSANLETKFHNCKEVDELTSIYETNKAGIQKLKRIDPVMGGALSKEWGVVQQKLTKGANDARI